MKDLLRDIRLIPVVLFAAACLLALKVIGIVRDGGYTLGNPTGTVAVSQSEADRAARNLLTVGEPQQSWAQEMFSYPTGAAPSRSASLGERIAEVLHRRYGSGDITGSISETKPVEKPVGGPAQKPGAAGAVDPPRDPGGSVVTFDPNRSSSPAERAILERLQERRQEIEARARELEIREGLLKAAEKQLETRLAELKELEARVNTAVENREDSDARRFKALVAMYENMKPKDAAKIFDQLDINVLIQVTSRINPRQMSEILGQMAPEAAKRLTVELANRAMPGEKPPISAELPKIQGKPGG